MPARLSRLLLALALTPLLLTKLSSLPTTAWADEGGIWQAQGGPQAFVTHIAADPAAPDFLVLFLNQSIGRNPDRTQAPQGYTRQAWAPYISDDGGDSWQSASNDLAGVEPTVLTIIPGATGSTTWVGTTTNGLWRSDNSGRTWRPALVHGLNGQRVVALARDVRGRLHLLSVDNRRYPDSHLFTSTDGGYNWERRLVQSFTGRPETYVTDLVTDPFEANRLYAVTFGGVLTSADAGFTWKASTLPLPENALPGGETVLAADPTQRGRLYLVSLSSNFDGSSEISAYQTLDSANTWQRLPARFDPPLDRSPGHSPHPLRLRLDPLNRRQLYLATSAGLWISADDGLSWKASGGVLDGVTVADVIAHPRQRGRWIAIGAGGIWRTANAGGQWQTLNQGLPPASSLRSLIALPDGTLLALNGGVMPIAAGVHPLWRSTDNGKTWLPSMRGLSGVNLYHLQTNPSEPGVVYALSFSGVARSTDAGRSWQLLATAMSPNGLAFGRQNDTLLIASAGGILRSTDAGQTWQQTSLTDAAQALANDSKGDILGIVAGAGGIKNLWRTQDDGQTWQMIGPVPAGEIVQLAPHPGDATGLTLVMRWGGLQRSRDGGRTWSRSDAGIPLGVHWQGPLFERPAGANLLSVFIDPQNPNEWWTGRDGGGVYHSTDNGRTWTDATSDLGDALVYAFARNGESLVGGTGDRGLIALSTTGGPQSSPAQIDSRIEILWPHEFAPVTNARQGNLALRLYKSRTQEVPPCAWMPTVEVWMARDAQPLRRLGQATQRTMEGHPFPSWELNDIDLTWANDPQHKLIFMASVAPELAENFSSPWIHAADARTYLPEPPEPQGLTPARPAALDAIIRVVWPHDEAGNPASVEQANLANISAVLFARDTHLTLRPEQLPARVWLVAALDNQVGRRLLVGEPRLVQGNGFNYTAFEFNNVDVSLARDPAHHWTYWLDIPNADATSNVWVHGIDGRTRAPELLEPIAGCQP